MERQRYRSLMKLSIGIPQKIEGWMVRGLVHELGDEYELAATDMTRAIELNSLEPHLYYSRGRYSLPFGR